MYFERRDSVYWMIRREFNRYPATYWLIVVMFIILIGEFVLSIVQPYWLIYLAFSPFYFLKGFFWTAITHIFVHNGFFHYLFNMIALYFIGRYLEDLMGTKYMLLGFTLAGIGGAFLTLIMSLILPLVNPFSKHLYMDFFVGASGAILGLFAILAADRPNSEIIFFLFFPIIPLIIPIKGKARNILILLILYELIFGLLALPGDPYGRFGHLGGMITGYLLYRYYLWRKVYERAYGVRFYNVRGW